MSEYGGIDMKMGKGKGNAKEMEPNQGGNKAAERPGANKGDVDHHMVDRIDHGKTASRAKAAMAEHGHHNVKYHDGGEM
jgi:hypothetical protein